MEKGIFRYNVDPSADFNQYATPNSSAHTAKIQAQPDDSDYYSHPGAKVTETADTFEISSEGVSISLDKVTEKMTVKNSNNEIVLQESAPLTIQNHSTIQTLTEDETEYFYGGGTQNERFSHKGKSINIVNESAWTDGGVSSPNSFYWSTKGYGVFRNTFKQGVYNFKSTNEGTVTSKHNETEFDAYYFVAENDGVANKAEEILNDYYKVTGNPVVLPEYAYYLAHLNCYNRDGWKDSTTAGSGWKLEDGNWYTELGKAHDYRIPNGTQIESLNNEMPTVLSQNFGGVINENTYKFSTRAVIDGYADADTPLGWFLPNDGYGRGYGQNGYYVKRDASNPEADLDDMYAAVDANVANLKSFVDYAGSKGVKVGLWTQSALDPLTSEKDRTYYHGYQNLRNFNKEVNDAGVVALKTDVAWVGSGYSFALNSTKTGYDIVAKSGVRPNLVSLDGWAGSQRYTAMWTGDQTGGNWE